MRSRSRPFLALIVLLTACDGLPNPSLEVSPASGRAPLEVSLDASGSSNPAEGALSYRFDVDGDGTWDTEPSSEPVLTRVFETRGSFTPRVEVTNERGSAVGISAVEVAVQAAMANIDVDADRNGVVEPDDGADEHEWMDAHGAVFFSNWDDDDGDGWRDSRDAKINGDEDEKDMAEVIVRHSPDLPSGARAMLRVEPAAAADRVRIFDAETQDLLIDLEEGTVQLSSERMREDDRALLLEGVGGRSLNWDGRVRLVLSVEVDGEEESSDEVELRAAPTLFPDHTQPAERLYVMRISDFQYGENLAFFGALEQHLDPAVTLYAVDQYRYYGDRWVQDSMQTGYQRVPGPDGPRQMFSYLETERMVDGLEDLVPEELLNPDFGFAYAGGADTSLNYGGNLEVTPPHEVGDEAWPFGRIIVGGGDGGTILGRSYSDHMNPQQLGYLDAQELQGPAIELSSEWLAVGHIDEVLLFVPDNSRPERPWRLVVASPSLAKAALDELEAEGLGGLSIFAGRAAETTVSGVLGDANFLSYNQLVQARIDSIVDELSAAMGLEEEDVVELPVLFERLSYWGMDYSVAYNPGMANLVVANSQLFIPDPEGPRVEGVDVWQEQANEGLAPLGLDITYVDVFESYHELMGEAHCGTNVRHSPYAEEWWTQ